MEQVRGLAHRHIFVSINEANVTDNASALKRVSRHATHQAATTDDRDFHGCPPASAAIT